MTTTGRGTRRMWAVLGLLGLAGAVGIVATLLWLRGWDETAKAMAVISFLLVVAPLAVRLLTWSRHGVSAAPTGDQVEQARELLAARVSEQWRRESTARALGDPEPMPVRWALTEHPVMDHPRLVLTGPDLTGNSADIESLAGEFTRLTRQRLVILGPAGAGKTTLAVQLLLQLLATRTPDEPVPVLLSLAGWDTTTAPRLQDWLTDRISQDYPAVRAVHPDAARALVEQGLVLPVLDGLDELPDEYRPTVITAINSSLTTTDALVLTCRTDEYRDAVRASDVLTAAAVIEPEPLSPADAAAYLHDCLPPDLRDLWQKVLAALRAEHAPALAKVCATPLGLWLVRMVHIAGRTAPTPLLGHTDAATIRAELLDQLIPTAIRARPPTRDADDPLRPRRCWDPTDVRRWLSLLAHQLDGQRDLLWWHLARHTFNSRLGRFAGGLAVGLVSGLVIGLAGGLSGGLTFGLTVGLTFGLTAGLTVGLAVGLTFRLTVELTIRLRAKENITDSEPKYANFQWHARAILLARKLTGGLTAGLAGGLTAGLAFGLMVELAYGLAFGLMVGLAYGLMVGLAFGLASGLSEWIETPSTADRAGTPLSTYRSDRAVTVIQTALFGVAGGLAYGVAGGLAFGLAGALTFGLAYGVAGGLAFGLVFGLAFGLAGLTRGSRAWLYCVIAARWLAVTGRLPWRLMGFLDDAYRLGLLRTVGPAYQFRHAELQDHLAGSHPARPKDAATATT